MDKNEQIKERLIGAKAAIYKLKYMFGMTESEIESTIKMLENQFKRESEK